MCRRSGWAPFGWKSAWASTIKIAQFAFRLSRAGGTESGDYHRMSNLRPSLPAPDAQPANSPPMTLPLKLDCGPLEIEFVRQQDRIVHTIRFAGQPTALLTSSEGTDRDDWPASPPLRDIHVESRNNGQQVALLVGMAGTSHWSASFEVDPRQARIVADVACRLHQLPGLLASTYTATDAQWTLTKQVAVAKHADRIKMAVLTVDSADTRLIVADGGLQILYAPAALGDSFPVTVRWKYQITGWPARVK